MKLTIPLAKNQWSKLLAIFHCYACPLFIAFATQRKSRSMFRLFYMTISFLELATSPVPGWAIALAIGILPSLAIVIFTESKEEPKHFRVRKKKDDNVSTNICRPSLAISVFYYQLHGFIYYRTRLSAY